MNDYTSSEEPDIPELEDILLKQIDSFKPLEKLTKTLNTTELCNKGTILEFECDEDENKGEEMVDKKYFDQDDSEDDICEVEPPEPDMTDILGDGGVLKRIVKHGDGPSVYTDSLCRVHYSAYVQGEVEPFDSTKRRRKSEMIKIGTNGTTIAGLQYALSTMKKGEEAEVIISSEYGYGEHGVPPRIPPNATLFYQVTLINFIKCEKDENLENESQSRSFEILSKKMFQLHREANDYFNNKQYRKSLFKYGKSLRLSQRIIPFDELQENEISTFQCKIFLNVALCSIKINKNKYAISLCQRALSIEPNNCKALFRLGQAYRLEGNYKEAKKYLLMVNKLAPCNNDIRSELILLSRQMQEYETNMRNMCKMMFNTKSKDENDKITKECDYILNEINDVNENLSIILEENLKKFSEDVKNNKIVLSNIYMDSEIALIDNIVKKFKNLSLKQVKDTIVIQKCV